MDKKALFTISATAPQPGAVERVLTALYAKQRESRLWRVRIFATTAFLSMAAFVPVAISLVKAFAASNFAIYISLIFSDGISYWKEIGASLIGSLPAVSLMLALALLGTFLWSLRVMVRFTDTGSRNFSTM